MRRQNEKKATREARQMFVGILKACIYIDVQIAHCVEIEPEMLC